MPDMPENDEIMGGGMLSQSELDSLLAAASAETPSDDEWANVEPIAAVEATAGDADPAPEDAAGGGRPAPTLTVDLPSFDANVRGSVSDSPGLSRVRDIPLEVTVELGRTRLLIRDILDLGAGSIIELDKIAGEPVDLFANGLLVARGEVVVIDDNFGVRVTEIITAADRQAGKEADVLAA